MGARGEMVINGVLEYLGIPTPAVEPPLVTFDAWLALGLRLGYCSKPFDDYSYGQLEECVEVYRPEPAS